MKRIRTDGDVPVAGSVFKERLITIGRVVVAGVVYERLRSDGRVVDAGCIGLERLITVGRIGGAGRKAKQCILPFCRVVARIASIRRRTYRLCVLDKRKADECKYDYNWWNDCFHIRGVSEKSRQFVEAIRRKHRSKRRKNLPGYAA